MKMGTIASPWHYDGAAREAFQTVILRCPATSHDALRRSPDRARPSAPSDSRRADPFRKRRDGPSNEGDFAGSEQEVRVVPPTTQIDNFVRFPTTAYAGRDGIRDYGTIAHGAEGLSRGLSSHSVDIAANADRLITPSIPKRHHCERGRGRDALGRIPALRPVSMTLNREKSRCTETKFFAGWKAGGWNIQSCTK
jgi:hypothetical protein